MSAPPDAGSRPASSTDSQPVKGGHPTRGHGTEGGDRELAGLCIRSGAIYASLVVNRVSIEKSCPDVP